MTREYHIDGAEISGISDLYEQFDSSLRSDADWRMGESLDALNDILYDVEPATVIWTDHARSRDALGFETTQQWLLGKLALPETFDETRFQAELDALRAGTGKTYFERVLEVFAEHPLIDLQLR